MIKLQHATDKFLGKIDWKIFLVFDNVSKSAAIITKLDAEIWKTFGYGFSNIAMF